MIESIRCSNCGSIAERHHLAYLAQVKTQCEACDYLLVMCTRSGHVIESYAPGLPSEPRPMQPISVRINSFAQPQSNNSRKDIAALKF
jgi:phage FluMu protein Com